MIRPRAPLVIGLVAAASAVLAGPAVFVGPAALVGTASTDPAPVATRCTVSDPRLAELSGLAVDGDAVWAMGDGGRRVALYRLDPRTCAVVDSRTAAVDPFDAEDLARGPDGTLWVSDTGDNSHARGTVAMIEVPARGAARLHRLTYPDGPHDGEALLVGTDGVPVIVTKEPVAAAGVYVPEGPLATPGPTPLVRVGEIVLPVSRTPGGPSGAFGSRLVTGAALSLDGRVAALRSYTDAWLYPVGGDGGASALVAALRADPVQVPLPDEPQGEAIAFDAAGTLLSGSETRGGVAGALRAVTGAAAAARTGEPATPAPDPAAAPATDGGPGWPPAAIGAAAVVGLLVLAGLAAALRARRPRRPGPAADRSRTSANTRR